MTNPSANKKLPTEAFMLMTLFAGFSGFQAIVTASYREPYLGSYQGSQAELIGCLLLVLLVWGLFVIGKSIWPARAWLLFLVPYAVLIASPMVIYRGVVSRTYGIPVILGSAAVVILLGHIMYNYLNRVARVSSGSGTPKS